VAPAAAPLILEAVPSLAVVLGDRGTAVRALEACYRAERTELAHRFGMLAEEDGVLAGLVIAFPGRLFGSLKLGTGVVLARTSGARHAADLIRRGRVLDRLLPTVPPSALYVSCLSVAPEHRRRGLARALMDRVIAGATRLGLDVALDVGVENSPAKRLYERLGFRVTAVRELDDRERRLVPVRGSARMIRPRGTSGGP
jgi:ribosomal protein S18 acetylase RimI-like enzyme